MPGQVPPDAFEKGFAASNMVYEKHGRDRMLGRFGHKQRMVLKELW
jgi:hypothetical protein